MAAVSGTPTAGRGADVQETMRGIVWAQFRHHPVALVALATLAVVIVASLLAFLSPYDPNELDLTNRWAPPSLQHWFGTDKLGRDLFTRILYGGRISLTVGFLAMAGSVLIGTFVGAIAGFFGGSADSVLMRVTDFALTFPQIFVLLFLSAILLQATDIPLFKGGFTMIVLVIALTSWMIVARLVRASFLAVRETEYIAAARSYGAGSRRLVMVHILPNAVGPILVAATRGVADAILLESGLSFLGYGIQPPPRAGATSSRMPSRRWVRTRGSRSSRAR